MTAVVEMLIDIKQILTFQWFSECQRFSPSAGLVSAPSPSSYTSVHTDTRWQIQIFFFAETCVSASDSYSKNHFEYLLRGHCALSKHMFNIP